MMDFKNNIFPSGMNGENTKKLANAFRENNSYNLSQSDILATLNNISTAEGDNLRRIGINVGFLKNYNNDSEYRSNLLIFIYLKKSNGSVNFLYKSFKQIMGIDIANKIDVWSEIVYDGGSNTFRFYRGRADFHKPQQWEKWYENLSQPLAFVGRRIDSFEILEERYEEQLKDPQNESFKIQLFFSGFHVITSETYYFGTRQNNMNFIEFNISNINFEFDTLKFIINNEEKMVKTYSPSIKFNFKNKSIRILLDIYLSTIGYTDNSGDIGYDDIFDIGYIKDYTKA